MSTDNIRFLCQLPLTRVWGGQVAGESGGICGLWRLVTAASYIEADVSACQIKKRLFYQNKSLYFDFFCAILL
jgi:hypothetical protein